jgi:CHAT domain-containing protein/Tfp pilus assembly protein PilF
MQRAFLAAALITLGCAACATVTKEQEDPRLAEAEKAFEEGEKLVSVGQYAQAAPRVERALELQRSILGGMDPKVARSLHSLGRIYRLQGDYARSERLIQGSLDIREAVFGQHSLEAARSLTSLATTYIDQGQYGRAEPLLERVLAIQEAAHGKDHPDVARALNNLGNLYSLQGNHAWAEPLHARALAIQEAALEKNDLEIATSLTGLANAYAMQGQYARASLLYERNLALVEAALGKDHPDVAEALSNLASSHAEQGDYARAELLYERALAIEETAFGKAHPLVADTLHNLANLYREQGQYGRAEEFYERARGIWESSLGKNSSPVARALNSLALLSMDRGDYARAEPLYESALAIREETLGEDHPDVAVTLHNLALLCALRGDTRRAESLSARALEIREAIFGKHHPVVAASLISLANLRYSQGSFSEAGRLYERALEIQETALGKTHPYTADSLNNLANVYMALGDSARAEPLYERALEIREASHGRSSPKIAASLNSLGLLRLAQQRLADALPLFKRAFSISEEHLRHEVFSFSEMRLTHVLHLLHEDEKRLYALARAYPGDTRIQRLALTAALLRKGRSVEEIANTSRIIYRGLSQADWERFARLRDLRTQLSRRSFAGPGPVSLTDYQQGLKVLADEGDELERDLARRSAPLRALYELPPPLEIVDRVAQALPRDGMLVEFVAYEDKPLVPKPGTAPSQIPSERRYLVFLLSADGRTSALDLGPAEPIDRAVLRLHHALAERAVAYTSASQALYRLVFQPLAPLLGRSQRLFLSPDGELALVPFAALQNGDRFLVDELELIYLTSGKDLLSGRNGLPAARSVVVLADPDFGAPPAEPSAVRRVSPEAVERSESLERFFSTLREDVSDHPWPSLPGTREEAEAIQHLFPQAELLLGRAATKEALLRLGTPGLLHIATHGFFLEDASPRSDTRALGSFGVVGTRGPLTLPRDPLLRSGLVLAGAHSPAVPPSLSHRQDSLVTALELSGLDLWGTQLVVLSACNSGRGDIMPGQGVYGLRRALVAAGAQTVVTSLWKVNDEATRQLMELYYRNLVTGQGRTSALRGAMRAFRRKHPHPYFWAPFIAIGLNAPLQGLEPRLQASRAP